MTSTHVTGAVAAAAPPRTYTRSLLRLVGTGLLAVVAAMVAVTLAAAIARALGVDFEVPEGGEVIPLSGFPSMTCLFSLVGLVIAAALLRWSTRPAARFVQTAVALTAVSLVPPFAVGASLDTALALVCLHLVPAAVVIPVVARTLRTLTD